MIPRTLAALLVVAVVVSLIGCSSDEESEPATTDSAANPSPEAENADDKPASTDAATPPDPTTPEFALRQFLFAMTAGDREQLEQLALPHEDLDVLFARTPLPAGQRRSMEKQLAALPITRLAAGDVIQLPGGQEFTIHAEQVTETRQQLTFPGNPIPFNLVHLEERWRVDAGPVIAASLAAKAARSPQ